MSIPKKGTRKISIDSKTFIWLIRRQATNCQTDYPDGHIHVAVAQASEPSSVLAVITAKLHSQGFILTPIQTVTLKDVAKWIKQAIQLG